MSFVEVRVLLPELPLWVWVTLAVVLWYGFAAVVIRGVKSEMVNEVDRFFFFLLSPVFLWFLVLGFYIAPRLLWVCTFCEWVGRLLTREETE